jgi:type VI secretion system secreted protein Hcp
MPIYLQYSAIGGNIPNVGKSQVYGMTQGSKSITPGNVSYAIQSPRDIATGQASGKRQHEPIKITKEWGAASPQFLNSLANNKVLPKLNLNFLKTDPQGITQPCFTITLTNAALAGYGRKPLPHHPPKHRVLDTYELEEIAFSFQKIVITHHSGGKTFTDNWDAPT